MLPSKAESSAIDSRLDKLCRRFDLIERQIQQLRPIASDDDSTSSRGQFTALQQGIQSVLGTGPDDCLLDPTRTLLVVLPGLSDAQVSLVNDLIADGFCGAVIRWEQLDRKKMAGSTVYLCGDLHDIHPDEVKAAKRIFIVKELAGRFDGLLPAVNSVVGWGSLPILVHGVGVYFRDFFAEKHCLYHRIISEHVFQSLTESTKPGTAQRTGIYLSRIQAGPDGSSEFNLLRCSSNLGGPTGNFGPTDEAIVRELNVHADSFLINPAPLNHILAQNYHNTARTADQKETKATIKAHADKTKDMPRNGVMAFCTFYDRLDRLQRLDAFDYGLKSISGLTKLHFRLKNAEMAALGLAEHFTLTLFPNSVFFMPLTTNRLYTHEIRSSALDAKVIPTRLGYVVRCSSTTAVHAPGKGTFLKGSTGALKQLQEPSLDGMRSLRELYLKENSSTEFIPYGEFLFSMNRGDYLEPTQQEPFRCLHLEHVAPNPWEQLQASVNFESVAQGRKGQILVRPEQRGFPLIRSTTKYSLPAQRMLPIHETLSAAIWTSAFGLDGRLPKFNNAMIEVYTKDYATMGFHSDQALDLEPNSYVALFSCYRCGEQATTSCLRKLVVESKVSDVVFDIPLLHNSVVIFSVQTNSLFRHKIVLDSQTIGKTDNEWLGITFRTSKTFLRFHEDGSGPIFEDGRALRLGDAAECKTLYSYRSLENSQASYMYPTGSDEVRFTVSESDLKAPE
jgi:hypothetical protein